MNNFKKAQIFQKCSKTNFKKIFEKPTLQNWFENFENFQLQKIQIFKNRKF